MGITVYDGGNQGSQASFESISSPDAVFACIHTTVLSSANRMVVASNIEAVIACVNRVVVASNIQAAAASFSGRVVQFLASTPLASTALASNQVAISHATTGSVLTFTWKGSDGNMFRASISGASA